MTASEKERAFWDDRAQTEESAIDAIAADPSAWSGEVLKKCLGMILPALVRNEGLFARTVLDLGCGAGRLAIPIAQRHPRTDIVGLDISEAMLNLAGERRRIANVDNLTLVLGDGRTLPWQRPRFHAAYSMITLQHVPRDAQSNYLREVARCLLPGGVFRFQCLADEAQTFLHHGVNEEWIIEHATKAGLEVVDLERVDSFCLDPEAPQALWATAVKR